MLHAAVGRVKKAIYQQDMGLQNRRQLAGRFALWPSGKLRRWEAALFAPLLHVAVIFGHASTRGGRGVVEHVL